MNRLKGSRLSVLLGNRRIDLLACAVLSLLCAAVSAFVGIHGEFPLNDDWAYIRTTQNFVETGSLERLKWTWVPMIPHAGVGALFSWVFGFSCETLRLSNVLMGWGGVLGAFVLCRQVGVPVLLAFLGATVIALNPMHVNLSHTFMTDVPFATITTWSLVLLCRGLSRHSWIWIALGTALAEVAVLSRQPGLAIPIALVIVFVGVGGFSSRVLLASAITIALTAFTYLQLPSLILGSQDSGNMFGFSTIVEPMAGFLGLIWNACIHGLAHVSYLGFFLAPVTLGLVAKSRAVYARLVGVSLVLTTVSTVVILAYSDYVNLPLGLNMIYDFGLGSINAHGTDALPRAGSGVWLVVTILGFGLGFMALSALLGAAWNKRHAFRERADCLLLAAFTLVYLPPIIVHTPSFDRYLLPVLPPLLALLLLFAKARLRMASVRLILQLSAILALGVYAVAGTRDYLEHHRCRWALLNELMAQGIEPSDINGGFEFNCWYDSGKVDPATQHTREGRRYVVSFDDKIEGYHAIRAHSWSRILPPGESFLTVFEADK